jgi:hypothetical protein
MSQTTGGTEFTLRPTSVGRMTLLQQLSFSLFLTIIWSGGFFGGVVASLDIFDRSSRVPFLFFGVLTFSGIPLVVYFGEHYKSTEQDFYADQSIRRFWTNHRKVIKFTNAREVTLRKSILQRLHGLGTIYFLTSAIGAPSYTNPFAVLGFGNNSGSGINMCDISNSDETHERIRTLVEVANCP